MKIRMLVGLSGPRLNLAPGDEHEFEKAEAIRLISAGFAAPVTPQKTEAATKKQAPERRAKD